MQNNNYASIAANNMSRCFNAVLVVICLATELARSRYGELKKQLINNGAIKAISNELVKLNENLKKMFRI